MKQLQGKTDQYTITSERGQGGFGITYRAIRARDNQEVIVKTLRVERMKEWKSFELFEREANVMRSLSHPNIPAYVDYFTEEESGLVAIVQEYIEGDDLRHRMKHGPRLDEAQMLSWFAQMLEVLIYLHKLSPPVIHRDISPKNILLRPDGKAYLIDFGAVQAAVLSASTLASTSAGTFGYAPLEQFMGRAFPQSDLYGLAMTFLAVSTGKEPEEFPLQGIKVDVRAIGRFDARLQLLLEAMTEPDPGKRIADAQEALERLSPLLPKRAASVSQLVTHAVSREARPARSAPRDAPPTNARNERPRAEHEVASAAWIREQLTRQTNVKPVKSPPGPKADSVQNFVLSADGTQLLLLSWERNVVVDLETLESQRQDKLTDKAFNDEESCVSPDLRLIARKKGNSIQIQKADDKKVLQSVSAEYAQNLAFSPDGHFLLFTDGENVTMLGQRGEKITMPGEAAAFSADGRYFAISAKNQVKVGEAHIENNKLVWGASRTEPNRGGAVKRLAFSHDQEHVVVLLESNMYLLSVKSDTKPVMLTNIPRGDTEPTNVGFTADDRFVVICGEFRVQRYGNKTAMGAFFWHRSGGYWGCLTMSGGLPLMQLDNGFLRYVKATNKPPSDQIFWWRDEVLRSYLEGVSIEGILSPEDLASVEDFEARYAFLDSLRRSKVLTKNANLQSALNATVGATPYLPLIIEAAKTASDGPRFGDAQEAEQLSAQKIAEAASAFMRRPLAERQVLLEDHLRRLGPSRASPTASRSPLSISENGEGRGDPEELEIAEHDDVDAIEAELARELGEPLPTARSERAPGDRMAEAERLFQEGKRLEQKEDSKWFRRKEYSAALELFLQAEAMDHQEAGEAVRRVREKMS